MLADIERGLAAVLSSNVVESSRVMDDAEVGTLAVLGVTP